MKEKSVSVTGICHNDIQTGPSKLTPVLSRKCNVLHLEHNKARTAKDQRFPGTSNQLHSRKGGLHPYL